MSTIYMPLSFVRYRKTSYLHPRPRPITVAIPADALAPARIS